MGKAVLIAAALMLVAGNNARGDELFPAPTNPAPPAKTEPPPPAPGPGKIEVPPLPPGVEPNVADDPLLQMRLCLTHRLRGAISQQCRCPRDPRIFRIQSTIGTTRLAVTFLGRLGYRR